MHNIKWFDAIYNGENIGKYLKISKYGEILNVKNNKIKKYNKNNKNKYISISCLFEEGRTRYFYVHRLLACTFIPNPENKKDVNHIDGNKGNNNLDNLEWMTRKENISHAQNTGLIKPRNWEDIKFSKFTKEQADEIRKEYNSSKKITIKILCNKYNVCYRTIYRIITKESYYDK